MTDEQIMATEKARVQEMLAEAIEQIENDGGSVRFFAAAFLVAAFELHVEVEGTDNLQAAMARLGREALTRHGAAGSA